MSNYIMQVDFFGNSVRCETDGLKVSLNDLMIAGNVWRTQHGLASKQLKDIVYTQGFTEFKKSVSKVKGIPEDQLMLVVKGRAGGTMAHLHLAIYVAEQISPYFHVMVIDTFLEGKLLEFREQGGTEFKNLNACIDMYLPGRDGKDNKGVYITAAKMLRDRLLGKEAKAGDWDKASVAQTHSRYDFEKRLCDLLRMNVVKDWEHLKELIGKL